MKFKYLDRLPFHAKQQISGLGCFPAFSGEIPFGGCSMHSAILPKIHLLILVVFFVSLHVQIIQLMYNVQLRDYITDQAVQPI